MASLLNKAKTTYTLNNGSGQSTSDPAYLAAIFPKSPTYGSDYNDLGKLPAYLAEQLTQTFAKTGYMFEDKDINLDFMKNNPPNLENTGQVPNVVVPGPEVENPKSSGDLSSAKENLDKKGTVASSGFGSGDGSASPHDTTLKIGSLIKKSTDDELTLGSSNG